MLVLTNFSNNISYYGFPFKLTFSLLLGLFSSLTAIATMLGSICTRYIYKGNEIGLMARRGLALLIVGLAFWACPTSFKNCWILFIIGTFLLGFGLSFARFFPYTIGYELTEERLFVQIISSPDAISRLWQSCVSIVTVTISATFPLTGVVVASCIVMSLAIFPIKRLTMTLKKPPQLLVMLCKISSSPVSFKRGNDRNVA